MPPPQNIWIAASDGDIASVEQFIAADPSIVNRKDENGYTPLHAAASYNHTELLRALVLDHGGDVNIEDNEGDTPLFVAETVETARCLVEELGADINHQNDVGLTALDMIEDDGNFLHVVAYLHERMSGGAGEENGVLPPASGNVHVSYTTMGVPDDMGVLVADERQQRIAEIAEFADLDSQEAQRALRELITGVVRDSDRVGEEPGSERNVRPRQGGQ